jgi:predicted metal-dependent phosphotriesterase family hydrolase
MIRTVLGDIAPTDLGVCYAHEHLIIDDSYTTHLHPEFRLDSVKNAAAELTAFRVAGGRAMVDSMPCGGGRNVLKLAEISRISGVHILCPTGLHLAKYYPPGHWSGRIAEDELSELFVTEIQQGIDANDCGGPTVRRTSHRAGLIKVAGGLDHLSDAERRNFRAAAAAHRATGAPILTHTEQGTAALEQIEMLRDGQVDPAHIVLSHTDRKPDRAYHREIWSTGVRTEFDSAFRWKAGQGNPTRDLVLYAFEQGFGDRILLGMDAARATYWSSYGGAPGHTYLLTTFSQLLRDSGLRDADLDQIFVTNPRDAFTLRRP